MFLLGRLFAVNEWASDFLNLYDHGHGKAVNLFQKGRIVDLYQAKKTSKVLKLLKLDWELFSALLKCERIVVNHHLGRKNVFVEKKKTLNDCEHLKV